MNETPHGDDIILWPCGMMSDRRDLSEEELILGDYEVIYTDTPRWLEIVNGEKA